MQKLIKTAHVERPACITKLNKSKHPTVGDAFEPRWKPLVDKEKTTTNTTSRFLTGHLQKKKVLNDICSMDASNIGHPDPLSETERF